MPTLNLAIDSRRARVGARVWTKETARVSQSATKAAASVGVLDKKTKAMAATATAARGKIVALAGGFLGLVAARKAIGVIANFEETMLTLQGVAIDTTQSLEAQATQFAALEDAARRAGATTRFSATEAGEGLLFLARAGFDARQAITALPATLDLAVAGVLDLGEAADLSSNVLKQFGLETEEMTRIADGLVRTANSTNVSVRQLGESLKLAGPIAAQAGIEFEETARAIGVLGDAGLQGSLAGTNLRGVLLGLAAPTTKAFKAFKVLGVSASDLNPELNTLADIFRTLKPAIDALEPGTKLKVLNDIFGRRNAAAAAIFADNVERLGETFNETGRTAAELAELQDTGLVGSFKALISAVQEAVLQFGDSGFAGGLKAVVDTSTEAIRVIIGMSDAVGKNAQRAQALAAAFKGVAAALGTAGFLTIAVKVVSIVRTMGAAILAATTAAQGLKVALASTGIGLIAVAIGSLVTATSLYSSKTDEAATNARELTQEFADQLAAVKKLSTEFTALRKAAVGSDAEVQTAADRLEGLEATLDTLREVQFAASEGIPIPTEIAFTPRQLIEEIDNIQAEVSKARIVVQLEIAARAREIDTAASDALQKEADDKQKAATEARAAARLETSRGLAGIVAGLKEEIVLSEKVAASSRDAKTVRAEETAVTQARLIAAKSGIELSKLEEGRIRLLASEVEKLANLEAKREATRTSRRDASADIDTLLSSLQAEAEALEKNRGLTEKQLELEREITEARLIAEAAGLAEGDARLAQIEELLGLLARLRGEEDGAAAAAAARQQTMQQLADSIARDFGGAFSDVAFGVKDLDEAIEAFAKNAIRQLFDVLVTKQLVDAVSGGLGGLLSTSARGNVFEGGSVTKTFATGGILSRKTEFTGPDGTRNILAEAGRPEAVLPLTRDKRGNLAVSAPDGGGGGRSLTIVQNIQTPDLDGFNRSKRQLARDTRKEFGR